MKKMMLCTCTVLFWACSEAENKTPVGEELATDMVSSETTTEEPDTVAPEDLQGDTAPLPDTAPEPEVSEEPEVQEETTPFPEDAVVPQCESMAFGQGQHVAWMALGDGGHPWEALDVDANPVTCAPPDDCEQGLDNQLSDAVTDIIPLLPIPDPVNNAIEDGQLVLLLEFTEVPEDNSEFTINIFTATPTTSKEECNWQSETCQYTANTDFLDADSCAWQISFDNAVLLGDLLLAGGPDHKLDLTLPIVTGVPIDLVLHNAALKAELEFDDVGFRISKGVLAGALVKQDLIEQIQSIPEPLIEVLQPLTPESLVTMIETMLIPDIDTDGDGELDAVSLGIRFKTNPADIIGLSWDD